MATRKRTPSASKPPAKVAKKAVKATAASRSVAQKAREHLAVISRELAALKSLLNPRPGKPVSTGGSPKKPIPG